MPEQYETISKFDRIYGGLHKVALWVKATTIKYVQNVTGEAETYIVQTCRHDDGDTLFIEIIDKSGTTRVVLPPSVCRTIARQHDALTATNRSRASKATALANKEAGVVPFQKKKEA